MSNVISVLDSTGDFEIRWNDENAEEREQARRAVLDLKRQGYSFFLIDGSAADEVAAGKGALNCRRADPETLLAQQGLAEAEQGAAQEQAAETTSKRRGRKAGQPVQAVAVRPMRGG